MTKKVNKYFMIVAVVYIILSLAIPIVDYYTTKITLYSKGQMTNAQEYYESIIKGSDALGQDNTMLLDFYSWFSDTYSYTKRDSIAYKAIQELEKTKFNEVITWQDNSGDNKSGTLFVWYILDKVIWLFVLYCIFIIPMSMVDLFYKMIKKEVD